MGSKSTPPDRLTTSSILSPPLILRCSRISFGTVTRPPVVILAIHTSVNTYSNSYFLAGPYKIRPGRSAVSLPSSITTLPFTSTYLNPTAY
jgi:hypothetical protein